MVVTSYALIFVLPLDIPCYLLLSYGVPIGMLDIRRYMPMFDQSVTQYYSFADAIGTGGSLLFLVSSMTLNVLILA